MDQSIPKRNHLILKKEALVPVREVCRALPGRGVLTTQPSNDIEPPANNYGRKSSSHTRLSINIPSSEASRQQCSAPCTVRHSHSNTLFLVCYLYKYRHWPLYLHPFKWSIQTTVQQSINSLPLAFQYTIFCLLITQVQTLATLSTSL